MPYSTKVPQKTTKPMTDLSSQAQAIVDSYENTTDKYKAHAAVLRAFVDEIVPHEDEAPKAVFNCEPTLQNKDGTFRYDHGQYLRRQFDQDKLDIRWEQRQQTRAMMLAIVTELENV